MGSFPAWASALTAGFRWEDDNLSTQPREHIQMDSYFILATTDAAGCLGGVGARVPFVDDLNPALE